MIDGIPTQSQEQMDVYMQIVNPYWQIFWADVTNLATPGVIAPTAVKYMKLNDRCSLFINACRFIFYERKCLL